MTVKKKLFLADLPGCVNIDDLRDLVRQRGHESLTYDDPKVDNDRRALWGGVAVLAFADRTMAGGAGEDWQTIIGDLFADLMHLCDGIGEDFDALVDRGRMHYEPEREGY